MNYTSKRKMTAIFKNEPNFKLYLKTIKVNNIIRGCSGFIVNEDSKKVIYINTEYFLAHQKILIRTAKNIKDYTGGSNWYIKESEILESVKRMTDFDYRG